MQQNGNMPNSRIAPASFKFAQSLSCGGVLGLRTGFVILAFLTLVGCTRTKYRLNADQDAYCALHEKADGQPWVPMSDFSIYPKPHSRLYDPTPLDDPCLPIPSPQLYAYDLPYIPERDPSRFKPTDYQAVPAMKNGTQTLPDPTSNADQNFTPPAPEPRIQNDDSANSIDSQTFHTVSYQPGELNRPIQEADSDDAPIPSSSRIDQVTNDGEFSGELFEVRDYTRPKAAIPKPYWLAIPTNCLKRMLEFDSIIKEYEESFEHEVPDEIVDDAPRLALEDVIELTTLNSRDLQTQKENLYRTALALTLERFDYQLKPSVGGNRTATNFTHNRNDGITVNTLGIPTSLQMDRMLWTGGDLLARFANSVLLTFNGAQGFTADVGSELFFELNQSLLQRDIRLESLTQAERNLVYAARDFARFRKELFVQLASQYYSLIRQFRQIEIDSQNYFTLVREFNQREAELRGGFTSRIQVDQIEQQVISGRQGLLSSCTGLDNALDDLKVRIGLPTEQLLNLDLTELNLLTLRDELAVNAELIDRVQSRILAEQNVQNPDRATLLSSSVALLQRVIESIRLREKLGEESQGGKPFEILQAFFQVESARLNVEESQVELNREINDDAPNPSVIFQRRLGKIGEMLRLIYLQLEFNRLSDVPESTTADHERRIEQLRQDANNLSTRFQRAITDVDQLPTLLRDSEELEARLTTLVVDLDKALGVRQEARTAAERLEQTRKEVNQLLTDISSYLDSSDGGLVPVEIEMDDAMMTALVSRFDLINERGALADNWRRIKLAADDLKSILNLRAAQSIRTPNGVNRPFDFSFDDSTTSLSATFDAPFNRRAQRNDFRNALINYQAALRRLTQLEDNIKLAVRRDLRSLALGREQYSNDIASAALAFERVVSTELELSLGIGNVAARDFLESQNAYASSLSRVASRHIEYIAGRLQLFLDLESLTVGDEGFWEFVYDENHQPDPFYQLPGYALPAYGYLHPCLKYSCEIQRMLGVPTGTSMIHKPTDEVEIESIEPVLEGLNSIGETE